MSTIEPLVIVTGNSAKVELLAQHLTHPFVVEDIDLPEIQSLDVTEVVLQKASEAYSRLRRPVVVEDFSLKLEGLNGLLGPLVKWFTKRLSAEEICALLEGRSRRALVEIAIALAQPHGVTVFRHSRQGAIAKTPGPEKRFTVERIFVPEGALRTWSEMTDGEAAEWSVRAGAYAKLEAYLK